MDLAAYLNGEVSYEEYIASAFAEVGTRVLVAKRVVGSGPDDTYWTIMDRETEELIGSFGMMSKHETREEALTEAQRFGSKWDWPTDREWTQ